MGENRPSDDELAEAHRRIADAEHSLERGLLELSDALPDPEDARRRARSISENARVHDAAADRLERRAKRGPK